MFDKNKLISDAKQMLEAGKITNQTYINIVNQYSADEAKNYGATVGAQTTQGTNSVGGTPTDSLNEKIDDVVEQKLGQNTQSSTSDENEIITKKTVVNEGVNVNDTTNVVGSNPLETNSNVPTVQDQEKEEEKKRIQFEKKKKFAEDANELNKKMKGVIYRKQKSWRT